MSSTIIADRRGLHLRPAVVKRPSILRRSRNGLATAALCLATGLGAAAWSGHHALGQARVTLRATVDDPSAAPHVRRAALEAIYRDTVMDAAALRELAEDTSDPLHQDARNYLLRIGEAVSR